MKKRVSLSNVVLIAIGVVLILGSAVYYFSGDVRFAPRVLGRGDTLPSCGFTSTFPASGEGYAASGPREYYYSNCAGASQDQKKSRCEQNLAPASFYEDDAKSSALVRCQQYVPPGLSCPMPESCWLSITDLNGPNTYGNNNCQITSSSGVMNAYCIGQDTLVCDASGKAKADGVGQYSCAGIV